jgi:pSer/pThr/pTyr-binding forkhead associated (FHA) protein
MAAPSALLEVVAGKAVGMSIVVDDELVVGRNAEGAGKLAEDGELSRSHARIAIDGNGFCAVEDLGSTNGTFVNGLRITTPQTLSQGDTIEVGATTLVVRELPGLKAQKTSPGASRLPPPPPPPPVPAGEAPAPAGPDIPTEPELAPESDPPAAPDLPAEAVVAAPSTSSLSLQLEVDFSSQEARLRLDHGDEPVRLVCEDGVWRVASAEAATDVRDSA